MTEEHLLREPHHDGSALFVDAPASLGDRVPVRVRVPAGRAERGVHLRQVRDGEPHVVEARLDRADEHERWYVAELDVHNPVTSYRFLLDEPDGYRWLNGTGLHARDVPDAADFRVTVHGSPPAWARDAVVYQVFPDRFARSGGERPVPDWAEPAAWDDEPVHVGPSTPRQLYGGDLAGIEQRLDHLERLGVDVLYLTPVFPARSNHRYDASTFEHVDPVLGGDEALASLARAVHARGMRIMGDLTTNHTGDAHEWFARATSDPTSEEAGYYLYEHGAHVGWLGHASLPKLDHRAPGLARRLVDGPDSVVARWLREPFALDGWRIDVANMTGRYRDTDLTHEVARRVRRTLEATNPDALLVGEHFHDATDDLLGDGWHANMNYSGFSRPVWSWLAPPDGGRRALGLPVPQPRRPGSAMAATMREFAAAVPWTVTAHQWNMLGSHDTARIRTVLGSREAVDVAVGLLMTYPGTPLVFAGDEVGATGEDGEHARVTMPWDRPDRRDDATFRTYRDLVAVRRASTALRRGGMRWVAVGDDAVVFLRETPDERVLVAVARAPWDGVDLPGHLAADVSTLHGPDVERRGGALRVPGTGPSVGIWRLR
ncbi:glycoside hydrolase family 13 protein [Cellulomonas sp. APG4]|uniref:glycoside hydrolase family 13 protein n=1 Tax=Cellulomonas sp. APG4 TaxID=1538656 RepID=UPI00137B759A|nr:glycoside hydrolase family 13 protein [Cellulomonas sp. APG4]NCT90167.1 glycoside hydrolase family 13 protein [Cellulomonas sp. APG4]